MTDIPKNEADITAADQDVTAATPAKKPRAKAKPRTPRAKTEPVTPEIVAIPEVAAAPQVAALPEIAVPVMIDVAAPAKPAKAPRKPRAKAIAAPAKPADPVKPVAAPRKRTLKAKVAAPEAELPLIAAPEPEPEIVAVPAPEPVPVAAEPEAVPSVEALPVVLAEEPAPAPVAQDVEQAVEEENGFAELGLSAELVQAVAEMGYRVPTPIQAQAIPFVLMGRDVLGVAQTGTGKTASFTLPMIDILSGSRARARMPRSLILEPTRELALQVAENFVKYGKHLKLNHALLIGGESMSEQKDALMRGVDVLIATPGRLMDLFERGGLLLTDTRLLVIDEADRMLDMGFIPDVEKIVSFLPANRQTLFFSATMAPEIRRLADAFLQNPKEVTVSRAASVATTIVTGLALVAETDKREALRRLIRSENVQNALIFCNRKRDVDILYKSLKRHGFDVGALHGDMSQPERFATLNRFKANELRLLCCSDVAARGIDIGGLSHVFNFDVPIHAEDYVHRIGRTGRAGLTGHAYTLASPEDRRFVSAIEGLIGSPIPRLDVPGLDEVQWSEDDGRGRRGRGGRGAPGRGEKPQARVQEAAPAVVQEAVEGSRGGEFRRERPRRDNQGGRDQAREARPPREDRPAREERPVREDRPAREAPVREARAPRDERPVRTEPPRDDRARGRDGRRDGRPSDQEDRGPAVRGFGEDIPAFMLLRFRKTASSTTPSTDKPDNGQDREKAA